MIKDEHELIESELFKTAESLINSSFFSYFVDAIANRYTVSVYIPVLDE